MKSEQIEKCLNELDLKLRDKLKVEKQKNMVEITGKSKTDVCDYAAGRTNWSWKKILFVAQKLGL